MTIKLLVLDMDGTVRRHRSKDTFIQDPLDQEIIPEAQSAIARFAGEGYIIIGATNQGGVAAGHKTLEDAIAEQRQTLCLASQIESILFCPDYEGRQCYRVFGKDMSYGEYHQHYWGLYRKPNPGMINLAMYFWNAAKTNTVFVGDRSEDAEAARNAGVTFMTHQEWYQDI